MKLDRQYSSRRQQPKLGSFFKTRYIIVNHHCCSYQVMSKRWYDTNWRVQPLKNGVNQFYDIQEAIKWVDKGCPIDEDYITIVIWES
jgi:hypothetical protein